MTSILKKQLTLLYIGTVLGGALLWNGGSLRAQDQEEDASGSTQSRQKLTRDEAAKAFTTILRLMNSPQDYQNGSSEEVRTDAVSAKSQHIPEPGQSKLLTALGSQWKQPNKVVRVQSEGEDRAIVTVEDDPTPLVRPFVLIEENGSWGVDLVETYARWNNLEGVAKAQAIYELTGFVLEDLQNSPEIHTRSCQSNLKQIALGMAQYTMDYDEKYPLAKPWIDVIQPYIKSEIIFNCPALPKGQRYGYAYNSKLSNKAEALLSDTSQTVSVYETSVLKRNAYGMGENRAFRHQDGANYAFADGHVKWFDKSKTPSFNLTSGINALPQVTDEE
jgi:prepilin-type processing-associated H-X9-DG protein